MVGLRSTLDRGEILTVGYVGDLNVHNGHHDEDEDDVFSPSHSSNRTPRPQESELQPLTSHPEFTHDYGTDSSSSSNNATRPQTNGTTPQRSPFSPLHTKRKKLTTPPKYILPVDITSEDATLHQLATIKRQRPDSQNGDEDDDASNSDAVELNYEGDYLKSKLWLAFYSLLLLPNFCSFCPHLRAVKIILILVIDRWTGFLLMNIGETGNFISYAFAPASMVAPLGTVSVSSYPLFIRYPSIFVLSFLVRSIG